MEPRIGFSRQMARKYLKKYQVKSPPVPVTDIIIAEGIFVEATVYPDGTAGESWWEEGNGHILYHKRLGRNRLRFTLAHEFGHLVLRHHDLRSQDLSVLDSVMQDPEEIIWEPSDPLEVEANQFAAELLMPLALFKKEWQANPDGAQVPILAARYQVSQEAAWWQIRSFPMR